MQVLLPGILKAYMKLIIGLFGFQLLFSPLLWPGTVKLLYDGSVVKDARVISQAPVYNGENDDWGLVGYFSSNNNSMRTYFWIPLPSFINPEFSYSITSARFIVYFVGVETGPFDITLNEISGNWDENKICWNNKPQYNPASVDSITISQDNIWKEFTITTLVKKWIRDSTSNYGFVLKPRIEDYPIQDLTALITSDYSDISFRPYIEITAPGLRDTVVSDYKGFISGIMENDPTPVLDFQLFQNYPNPFNPTTAIKFSIPKAMHVSLSVYNTLGQEVTKLISSEMNAGNHIAEWNASGFTSGIYFYKLTTGDFTETKKLLLMK